MMNLNVKDGAEPDHPAHVSMSMSHHLLSTGRALS